jgi:ATP-dependent DNA helicase RecG
MRPLRIFISSVQKEFAAERAALRDYLRGDALMRRFFEPFLFENVPAADRRADEVYLGEVERCDFYLGLFGDEYGFEDVQGASPTEREFVRATELQKQRLIFVKGADDRGKHPKMRRLIERAGNELVRRRFASPAELITGVYAALVQVLEDRELIRVGPFDATPSQKATLADLDLEKMRRFIRVARRARGFPLDEEAPSGELLTHLNLLDDGRPVNAAVLLFARQPQRFLIASEVKCAHFHGTEVSKPIPSYQVYKGTVFDLVDQAIDFVMSKINLQVGTRAEGPQAPVAYELPREVVAEAIVNAVAHRDYTSNGSVQVMLFADRLEVWNPGALPPSLTLEKLRQPHGSVPANPLLAEPLYLARYIERMGTGIGDMIQRCREAGLPEPEFAVRDGFVVTVRRRAIPTVAVQPESRPELQPESRPESVEMRVLTLLAGGAQSKAEMSSKLGHKEISGQLNKVIRLLLSEQNIEQTIPDKPTSRLQKYRITAKGAALLDSLRKGRSNP